jgi:FkbM family methyltransferase
VYNHSQLCNHLIELLAQKRNYQQETKALVSQYEYVAFYGCGEVFHSVVDTWNVYIGRKIDYCCDSDSAKWGKYFYGAKCISPQELMAIKYKCAVFITIGEFKTVFKFLTDNGFPSVNLIYKYDIVISDFLANHEHNEVVSKLCQTYDFLSDRQSQMVFDAIINRIFGNGKNTEIMADICEGNQYFPSDIIKLSDHESFVDIGAFNGDTAKDFIERTHGKFDNIFSFEVDKINFNLLQGNVKHMPNHDRIKIFNMGIWDSECDITYSIGNSQSTIGTGEGKGHVVPLDDILKNEKVTFIKADIEGAEPQVLRGARNIIQTQKPRLAVCVYHDFRHLWEIPLYIKELAPEYKIHLRHHTNLEYETVCYAVV